jgi:hypothetical protein
MKLIPRMVDCNNQNIQYIPILSHENITDENREDYK